MFQRSKNKSATHRAITTRKFLTYCPTIIIRSWISLTTLSTTNYPAQVPCFSQIGPEQWFSSSAVHQNHLAGFLNKDCWASPQSFSFTRARVGPKNLHFLLVSRLCWCCWSRDYSLRITDLEFSSSSTYLFFFLSPCLCVESYLECNQNVLVNTMYQTYQ